jgi:hypothetical protein
MFPGEGEIARQCDVNDLGNKIRLTDGNLFLLRMGITAQQLPATFRSLWQA